MHIEESLNSGKFELLRQFYTMQEVFLISCDKSMLLVQIGLL
jgi:hypothetical protein